MDEDNQQRKRRQTTIHKRNEKKLRAYKILYPDNWFHSLTSGFLEQQVPTEPLEECIPLTSRNSASTHNVEEDHLGLPEVTAEENVEQRERPEVSIQFDEVYEEGDDQQQNQEEVYFSDSSEELDEAELIEHNYNGNPERTVDGGSDDDNDNSSEESDNNDPDDDNDDTEDGDDTEDDNDSEDDNTRRQDKRFLNFKNTMVHLPFITKPTVHERDHLISVIAMAVRHNFTYEATLNILQWIKNSHETSGLPTKKKALWKSLNRDGSIITRHLYCHECKEYLGKGQKPTEECLCKACRPNVKTPALKYFLQIDLSSQISELLSTPGIIESLNYRFTRNKKNIDGIEDIYDGKEYRKLCSPGSFLDNPYNYSLTMNTDGCQVSNSSNASAWPVYFQINELPPHMRKKHMLLAGIFVDDKHPLMNNFLRPYIDELKQLFEAGIVWKPSRATEVTSKFIVTICSVDSPARSLVTRTTQFNGYYGCLFCYAKGERNSKKHVYPINHNFGRIRSHKELKADMLEAYETKKTVNGVKGISSLIALPLFDIINGTVVEAMHAVFLGVVKQHTILLLTMTNCDFYIGSPNKQKEIDNRLLTIRPPSRHSRLPRSIKTFKQWKASEWRNWLDYAPVCLEGIIDAKYVEHIAILSQAIHYLNSDSLTMGQVDFAGSTLKAYVILFEEYFKAENMSFNVHLLTHITDTVRNWGPIWAHSAFSFESWNKKIIDKVSSPHARADQIVTRFLMSKFIELVAFDNSVSIETKNFIQKIRKNSNTRNKVEVSKNFVSLGSTEIRIPTDIEKRILSKIGYHLPEKIVSFKKVEINGTEYRCSDDNTKYCNSIVYCSRNGYGQIVAMIQFEQEDIPVHAGLFMKCFQVENSCFETHYIKRVRITDRVVFVNTPETIRPAVKISTTKGIYIFKLPNCWETD